MTIPQYRVYSASKRALLGFSLTARAELEKDHIEIHPFIPATNFGKNRIGVQPAADRRPITADGDKHEFVANLVLHSAGQNGNHG